MLSLSHEEDRTSIFTHDRAAAPLASISHSDKVLAARAEIKAWLDNKKTITAEKIADWRAKRHTSQLQNRADQAERNAAATIDVALTALDDAEQAPLKLGLQGKMRIPLPPSKHQTPLF